MERYSLQFRDRPVQSLLQKGKSKFIQLSLNPGQGLTKHRVPLALAVIVLDGAVRFIVGQRDEILLTADMLVLDPNVEHAVEALERSIVLLVLVPDTTVQTSDSATIKPDYHSEGNRH
jgi:quercetin dioxygenase-like cupin family protein